MNLIEGTKQQGLPFQIPDCSRNALPQFFVEKGYKVGAEIGVFQGEFTEKFCQAGLTMHAIDPWTGYAGAGRTEKVQGKQDINFEHAAARLSPSMAALEDFKNDSLDFVYIDGDHRFRYIAEDISEWFRKVKKGGAIAGHDYFMTSPTSTNVICQVEPVVDAFIKVMSIENLYVFESDSDRSPSWMFIKET